MLSESERLAATCSSAADHVAGPDSFVAIRDLLSHFNVELRAQPLLYEGIVAAPKEPNGKWLILIDSHFSGFKPAIYESESSKQALPPRLRFTIAHELIHVIQLAGGQAVRRHSSKKKSVATPENSLEDEADNLTPLLLVPETGLASTLLGTEEPLQISDLVAARERWGVSREVLVNRLRLLTRFDPKGLRFRPRLKDMAIGVGEWTSSTSAKIASWPQPFCSSTKNLVPHIFRLDQATESLGATFPSEFFFLNGGSSQNSQAEIFFGTSANPKIEKIQASIEIEPVKPRADAKFLFLLRWVSQP